MKPHKHAEIIKAWADGAKIQYKSQLGNCEWKDDSHPSFEDNYEYRIKPEPKTDVVFYGFAINGRGITRVFASNPQSTNSDNNLKLTFDGETGQLKAAEVLK